MYSAIPSLPYLFSGDGVLAWCSMPSSALLASGSSMIFCVTASAITASTRVDGIQPTSPIDGHRGKKPPSS